MPSFHHASGPAPAETSGRFTQTYASNRFTQIPRSNDVEWPGVGDGDASTSGGSVALCLYPGLTARGV